MGTVQIGAVNFDIFKKNQGTHGLIQKMGPIWGGGAQRSAYTSSKYPYTLDRLATDNF